MRDDQICGHCGAADVGGFDAGFSMVGEIPLCHPNAYGRPVCYNLVTIFKHALPCTLCTAIAVRNRERAAADHPYTDPADGRSECQTCGKWVWPVTHSCKGVPVTVAAMHRTMLL